MKKMSKIILGIILATLALFAIGYVGNNDFDEYIEPTNQKLVRLK